MKEFAIGILKMVAGIIVFIPMIVIGFIYSIFHAAYMTFTLKKWYMFFVLMWRNIDGTFAAIGHIAGEIGYGLDLLSNVNGEIYEDVLTTEENTNFGKKNISVSSSTGKLEYEFKIMKGREWFSKMLNWAFRQKQHAIDSYLFDKAKADIRKGYFK